MKKRAYEFVERWQGETYERGEAQNFWRDLLGMFDIDPKRVNASFEYRTTKLGGERGYIDLFWPGQLIAEHKSAGRDLTRALDQAMDYLPHMADADLPRAIVASDFAQFEIVYLDGRTQPHVQFALKELPRRLQAFSFLFRTEEVVVQEQDPVNIEAAENMARLHQELAAVGYGGADLELLLTRIVFCLFAEDTEIFEKRQFTRFVNSSAADGRDLGPLLIQLFEVLNQPEDQRQTNLWADLNRFRYINGGMFADAIRIPGFRESTRKALQTATLRDWSLVSPAIFGSMFQGVMDEQQRRNLGAHYTSERNILKLIQPLFLDDLYAAFERIRRDHAALEVFHDKLARLRFLDPACGCGNFLVIAYRELRRLEHKVLKELIGNTVVPVQNMIRVNVDQFYGIELEEFPARIAQLAMWITDHQMNLEAQDAFHEFYVRLPLTATPTILHGNALTLDWAELVDPAGLSYIMGNPPFIGASFQTTEMKSELREVVGNVRGVGTLDYVAAWYVKAARMMDLNPRIRSAFVSTNSITQGEQVAALWQALEPHHLHIAFGHRTFQWRNEARGVAAVHCVIVGLQKSAPKEPRLYTYETLTGEPAMTQVSSISPYLTPGPMVFVTSRTSPLLPDAPIMQAGGMVVDGGHFLLTNEERAELVAKEPGAEKYIRRYLMGKELINGIDRWCLWLADALPSDLRKLPLVQERIEAVRQFRLASKKAATRELAALPYRFAELRPTLGNLLALPEVSSERREYIPMAFITDGTICGKNLRTIDNATLYHFGILTSRMHMAWMRTVAGRLESRYRYSVGVVYNNFPWPEGVTDAQRARIETLAQAVLDARAAFPGETLADLYDPNVMPEPLRTAHSRLDSAVDRLYTREPFVDDAARVALLFRRYQALTTAS